MASYVVKCQGCGSFGPFLVRDEELQQPGAPGPLERYCPSCKKLTLWTPTFPDRRSGAEIPTGWKRRSTDH